jgi:acetoin:2,6-dichlorophenolindophenol oxidoreductase subunit alpha
VATGKVTEAQLANIESTIDSAIDDAEQFAFASPLPEVSELATDIYAERLP